MLKMMTMLTSTTIIANSPHCKLQCMEKYTAPWFQCNFILLLILSYHCRMYISTWFEWHCRNLQTWIYYYLYYKLQIISLTSELAVHTLYHLIAPHEAQYFIYLCKLITCCSTGARIIPPTIFFLFTIWIIKQK